MEVDLSGVKTPLEERIDRTIANHPEWTIPMVLGRHLLDPEEHYETVEKYQ